MSTEKETFAANSIQKVSEVWKETRIASGSFDADTMHKPILCLFLFIFPESVDSEVSNQKEFRGNPEGIDAVFRESLLTVQFGWAQGDYGHDE